MSHLSITVVARAADRLTLRCRAGSREASAEARLGRAGALEDLLGQARQDDAPAASRRTLGRFLGEALYAGEVGALLRDTLEEAGAPTVIALATDSMLAGWPWELSVDPESGRAPLLDGVEMVRVAGAESAEHTAPARGVLVVPDRLGHVRVDALQAATRRLARKAELEVFAADPATGPGLRRSLAQGAAFVHLEGVGEGGHAALDDGHVPVDRLGIGSESWLVVLGGTEPTTKAALRLREAGVPVVVARQHGLRPQEAGAVDRELYRALAGGASPVAAMRRVRRALARSGGDEAGTWAALTLWSAPGGDLPAGRAFPPPVARSRSSATLERLQPSAPPLPAGPELPYPDLLGPPGHPIPAPVFVHQTIRALQNTGAEPEPELRSRLATLRALGGGISGRAEDAQLSPDDRTARLTDRLVDAIGRPDLPLPPPPDRRATATAIGHAAAVSAESARRAIDALLAARAVWLRGPDGSGKTRLARYLTELAFDHHAQIVPGDTPTPLVGSPGLEGQGATGWLYRTVAANWRRDELDPLRPDQPQPRTRMRLVARAAGSTGWLTHLGGWLVLRDAHHTDPRALHPLLAAVEAGVMEGLTTDGRAWRLELPADFRLVFTGSMTPFDLPAWVPVVDVAPPADAAIEHERWLATAEARLGPAGDSSETLARQHMAERIGAVLRFVRALAPVPSDVGAAALAYAAQRGGEGAVDEALCLFLAPRLQGLDARRVELLRAWLSGRPRELFAAAGAEGAGADPRLLRGLAAWLDSVAPSSTPRVDALDRHLDAGDLDAPALVRGWADEGRTLPQVQTPELARAVRAQVRPGSPG